MDLELIHAAPGSPGPVVFLGVGCFSGPQGGYCLHDRSVFHWFCHCTRIAEYKPAHRRPDLNIIWVLGFSLGLRDSQRDSAEEVETEYVLSA